MSGYFDSRQQIWAEPLDRNVFGLLNQFGDAELAAMILPRNLVIEAADFPEVHIPAGTGGAAPAKLVSSTGNKSIKFQARIHTQEVKANGPIIFDEPWKLLLTALLMNSKTYSCLLYTSDAADE